MARTIHYVIVDEHMQIVNDPRWPARSGEQVVWLPRNEDLALSVQFDRKRSPFDGFEFDGKKGRPIRQTITAIVVGVAAFKYTLQPQKPKRGKKAGGPGPLAEPEIIIDGGGGDPDRTKRSAKRR